MFRSFRSILLALITSLAASLLATVSAAPICAYSGPAKSLPLTKAGNLNLKALGTPEYLRIIGCGGGGGGAGARRAPNTGLAASGAGGAGTTVISYFYGPTDATTLLPVTFTSDGMGGCGGAQDHNHCPHIPPGGGVPDAGESGRPGMTVTIGDYNFPGGDPGTWPDAVGVSLGGKHTFAGGGGGASGIAGARPGSDAGSHKGGAAGTSGAGPGGNGGNPGGGGGASSASDGGQGGRAGAGDGNPQGAANNAEDGKSGGACAGGGGGGGAAGGTFQGANGGDGGESWIVIYNIGNKVEYEAKSTESAAAEVAMLGHPCGYLNITTPEHP